MPIHMLGTTAASLTDSVFDELGGKRRLEAGLVLQLVPGFLLADVPGSVLGHIGNAATLILAEDNDDDHTGGIARLLAEQGHPAHVASVLEAKSTAIIEGYRTGAISMYPATALTRMAMEIRSIAASLQAWRVLVAEDCANDADIFGALALCDQAHAIIDESVVIPERRTAKRSEA